MSLWEAEKVWIDDGCDVCGAADCFGVLLRKTVLCVDCLMSLADAAANHPGGRPERGSRAARGGVVS